MSSDTIMKLPIVDFSNLKQGTPSWESVKEQVREALEKYGSFEAVLRNISPNLRESVFEEVKKLFDLPLQNKLENKSGKDNIGYAGQIATRPLYQSFGLQDVLTPGNVEGFENQMWSQGNPMFSKSVISFSEQLSELDLIVRTMILESLGLQKYMEEHTKSTKYNVRVHKYDTPRNHDSQLALKSHTDKNYVTILCENEVQGLQVLTKDGIWINFQPSLNSFIILIGDSFHAWTNGRLHSSYHRVIMKGNSPRYSFGLFSSAKYGEVVKAPKEMVDEEHPLLYMPFIHAKFIEFYLTDAGQKSPFALKDFCGI